MWCDSNNSYKEQKNTFILGNISIWELTFSCFIDYFIVTYILPN